MILFWVACAIMIVLAIAFILSTRLTQAPTTIPDETGITDSHPEPPSRNQQNPKSLYTTLTLAICLPVGALVLYYQVGTPSAIPPTELSRISNSSQAEMVETKMLSTQSMLDQVREHLSTNPDDEHGWVILAKSMMSLGNYTEAINAYEQLIRLGGRTPQLLALYADALAMSSGSFLGKPSALLQETLIADPLDPIGLWLSGVAAQERGEYKEALAYWYRLKPILEKQPDSSEDLIAVIKYAEEMVRSEKTPEDSQAIPNSSGKTNLLSSQKIGIEISINPNLTTTLVGDEVLFVYAKARGDSRPIAAVRHTVSKWPAYLVLDESSSILAGTSLFDFDSVIIGGHISRSGDAISRSGDLLAEPVTVKLPNSGVTQLRLTQILP